MRHTFKTPSVFKLWHPLLIHRAGCAPGPGNQEIVRTLRELQLEHIMNVLDGKKGGRQEDREEWRVAGMGGREVGRVARSEGAQEVEK